MITTLLTYMPSRGGFIIYNGLQTTFLFQKYGFSVVNEYQNNRSFNYFIVNVNYFIVQYFLSLHLKMISITLVNRLRKL